jgi:hypothetical protein
VGPFDGWRVGEIDLAVQIYDLSEGGCFINSAHEPTPRGRRFDLRIDLAEEGKVTVQAEALYARPGYGFAVRFAQVSDEGLAALRRALERRLP